MFPKSTDLKNYTTEIQESFFSRKHLTRLHLSKLLENFPRRTSQTIPSVPFIHLFCSFSIKKVLSAEQEFQIFFQIDNPKVHKIKLQGFLLNFVYLVNTMQRVCWFFIFGSLSKEIFSYFTS